MGNKLGSQVSDAVKQQAAGGAGQTPIYQYTDVNGGGELIELMKKVFDNLNRVIVIDK